MLPFLEHDNKHFNTQRSLLPDPFAGCTCKISSTCGATSEHALCVQRSDTIDSSNCAVLSSRHSRNIKKKSTSTSLNRQHEVDGGRRCEKMRFLCRFFSELPSTRYRSLIGTFVAGRVPTDKASLATHMRHDGGVYF